ncbi:dihydrolipoamide acetyltransferase family protein [Actinoplanes sp. NPDC051861]|uniref:dihydrolipoamide acetyltransferase family protein n=1 Tax=Actinoplanes sp. NPDC051861 TaxID=3155170 RepID=UPI0034304CB9
MAALLRMPAISANLSEAVLNEWPLAENASFSAGDPIATVETDKAVVDIPADTDGVLLKTLIEPGRTVAVGTPLAVLAAPGEVIDDVDALVSNLTGSQPAAVDRPERRFASPLARKLARDNGLTLADLDGTGPGGRIVRADIHRALATRTAPATSAPVEPVDVEDVPHSRMRRAIAERLSDSARDVPVFTIRGSARVDALLEMRAQLNTGAGVKISLNDLIVAAAARTHVAIPDMNVIWTENAVRKFRDVDIAIAVATDRGLVTPVVRGVSGMRVSALAAASADLVARARDGRLRQNELEGGTLTVTNLGVFGTEEFDAVINPPQAAILAVGAARPEAVAVDGELAIATVLRVTLSVDHRPVDGALAAAWMAHFLGLLEAPLRILA